MKSFKEYLGEGCDVVVVSIEKNNADFNMLATRMEINQNLALVLSPKFFNPYMGWIKVSKVLAMYGITLPRVIFKDLLDGEEIVVLQQFGEKTGVLPTDAPWNPGEIANVAPPHEPEEHNEYYLVFNYTLDWEEGGFYNMTARVVDEEELNDALDDEDEDIVDAEGDLDPRQ